MSGPALETTAVITRGDRLEHFLARWGVRRFGHRVQPGLWALGRPGPSSPVLVTANYTLSFDALRGALPGHDAWILVLDTGGVNVWCAAGEGTFGTAEVARRVRETRLADLVAHRRLILPQLSAPGVSALEVRRESGFRVEFGPVRATDVPAYLRSGEATPAMRRVVFGLRDRAVLIPVELVHVFPWMCLGSALLFVTGGVAAAAAGLAAVLGGTVLFPILLPWLPTAQLSTKGFILGGLLALPFAAPAISAAGSSPLWARLGTALAALLAMPAVTAFLALNFTGSTPFTSRSGVRREILSWVPAMAWMFGGGLALGILTVAFRIYKGI